MLSIASQNADMTVFWDFYFLLFLDVLKILRLN
nr:MAG TPA: hypothetical protein [Caudoviricetes sp.]DAZ24889.1 MAG TPA: hypothetical protein [Caudoviricetes sp.]